MSRAFEIFARALDETPRSREAFVRLAAGEDPGLRDEVASLLASHAAMGGFLESDDLETEERAPVVEPDPRAVPGHELLRKLGEGGFGTVHLAQEDGDVRRPVAVKFLKHAVLTARTVEQFQQERQILAGLEHEGIARIYRAGTTGTGCPYYTMEWVDGRPLDEHCDERRLVTGDRVELFLLAAAGVAHAHEHGVIHGDLKPRNILVGPGERPKVIDFGIARSLHAPDPESGAPVGTPRYMSPEQRAGTFTGTRCDIYALGVILHELLVGRLVTTEAEEHSPRQSLDELDDVARARRAADRGLDAARLRKDLRGELDHVVRRATQREPEARYATVREMMADLEAWCERRPLPSRPRTLGYLLRCFFARHRLASLVGIGLFLIAGATLGRAKYLSEVASEARAETRVAERERDVWGLAAVGTLDFFDDVFMSVTPERRGLNVPFRQVVDDAEQRFRAEPPAEPMVTTRIALTLGRLRIQLDQYEAAESLLRTALASAREAEMLGAYEIALIRMELSQAIGLRRHTPESIALLESAREELDPALAPERFLLASRRLAVARLDTGDPKAFLREMRVCFEEARRRLGEEANVTRIVALELAGVEECVGDRVEAERLRVYAGDAEDAGLPSGYFGAILLFRLNELERMIVRGDLDEAETEVEALFERLEEKGLGRATRAGSAVLNCAARIAQKRGDRESSLRLSRERFEAMRTFLPAENRHLRQAGASVAGTLVNLMRLDQAATFLGDFAPLELVEKGMDPASDLPLLTVHAALLERRGESARALVVHDRIVDLTQRHYGSDQLRTLKARRRRAATRSLAKEAERALAELVEVRRHLVALYDENHREVSVTDRLISQSHAESGRLDEAETVAEARFHRMLAAHGPNHSNTRDALLDLLRFAKDHQRTQVIERARKTVKAALSPTSARRP